MSDEKKNGLFDKLKGVVNKLDAALPPELKPATAPLREAAPRPSTAPLKEPGPRSMSAPLKEPGLPGSAALKPAPRTPGARTNAPGTRPLGDQRVVTAPLQGAASDETGSGLLSPDPAELSPRRLAMIDDFMNGRIRIPQMKDPTFMYKIVADERSYQADLLKQYRADAEALLDPPESEAAQAMQQKIQRSQAIVANLFKVLKYITGKKGKTGGSGFF